MSLKLELLRTKVCGSFAFGIVLLRALRKAVSEPLDLFQ